MGTFVASNVGGQRELGQTQPQPLSAQQQGSPVYVANLRGYQREQQLLGQQLDLGQYQQQLPSQAPSPSTSFVVGPTRLGGVALGQQSTGEVSVATSGNSQRMTALSPDEQRLQSLFRQGSTSFSKTLQR